YAMDLPADRLHLHLGDALSGEAAGRLQAALTARLCRQPVSQIIGNRLFWGRAFRVTPDVLDPRPETECLIEAALAAPCSRVLDLGTGSGVIAVTLLAERPEAQGLASDISTVALAVARENAARHGLGDRLRFKQSDWFEAITGRFDLIVSNPPYITATEMATLCPEVRDWEPHLALTPGGDGLDAYRAIAAGAMSHLLSSGRLIVEIGPTQAAAVTALFVAAGMIVTATLQDLDGRDRVVCASRG
ncbi:MAG: peptide chain release factor N(5)-glutamine methyltransferase, partial [Erythrobacter sp.]|nr:peptide chain release factor N(5)-glutamine methyltransferase [Erythrobacter sp.]